MSKFFGEEQQILPPEEVIRKLFYAEYEVAEYVPSQNISPSGMGCPIACAFKLNGVPVPAGKASFYCSSAADNGSDRHERIQEFLSRTPYWVDVADYIAKRPELEVRVVTAQEQAESLEKSFTSRLEQLNILRQQQDFTGAEATEYGDLVKWLSIPIEQHAKEIAEKNRFEVLLLHTKYPIRFRCDGMLRIDGKFYVLEIKTERQSKNSFRIAPDPKHAKQGITYEMSLKPDGGIIWLYEGRDALEPKTFLQLPDEQACKENEAYIANIVAKKDTPWLLEIPPASACTYCEYKAKCKEEKKKWKEMNKTRPLQI